MIADKLQTIQNIKQDIKTSIQNKGVEVGDDFTTYSTAIDNIQGGGGITKISVKDSGIKFGNSTFKEIPEYYDFEGITDVNSMFYKCVFLTSIPLIDTSKVTDMNSMFRSCVFLTSIPLIDTSKVTDMSSMFQGCGKLTSIPLIDTSKVTNMNSMFSDCTNLITIPQLDTRNVTNVSYMFQGCTNLTTVPPLDATNLKKQFENLFGYTELPKLTDFGGLINLKAYHSFVTTPNLTYQSCINILNGLYDFNGNGETPNSEEGKLKVHSNFLTTVGDEISIATTKGWIITT